MNSIVLEGSPAGASPGALAGLRVFGGLGFLSFRSLGAAEAAGTPSAGPGAALPSVVLAAAALVFLGLLR